MVASPDRRSPWYPAVLLAGTFTLYLVLSRPSPAPAGWDDDLARALAEAASTRKSLVVDFYSEGCPPCVAMDRTVLGTAEVRKALSGFIPVRVNVATQPELAARFQIFATPTFAVVDPRGEVIARCQGYQSVEEFVAFLNRAATPMTNGHWPAAQPPRVDP